MFRAALDLPLFPANRLEPLIFLAALLLTSQMLIAPPPFPALLRVNVLRVITPVA
jgi:hypothetical protein